MNDYDLAYKVFIEDIDKSDDFTKEVLEIIKSSIFNDLAPIPSLEGGSCIQVK